VSDNETNFSHPRVFIIDSALNAVVITQQVVGKQKVKHLPPNCEWHRATDIVKCSFITTFGNSVTHEKT